MNFSDHSNDDPARYLGAGEECFLCCPDKKLIVATGKHVSLIAGLGPVVDNYCILSSTQHFKSFADVMIAEPAAITELSNARERVEAIAGHLLLTEHGRVPICRDDGDRHEEHCHHAHCLVFPADISIRKTAATYYRSQSSFSTLGEALLFAATTKDYLLISESRETFLVLFETLGAPRQLARTLVAHELGNLGLADWRAHPNYGASVENADRLRNSLQGSIWER